MSNLKQSDLEERKRIYYSAIVNAFIDSSMERDRNLLNLSAGGIGLLVTLMTTVGVHSTFGLCLYISSIISFSVAIILILHVFKLNKSYLLKLATDEKTTEVPLKKYDSAIFILFILGIIFLFSIGLSTANHQLNSKESQTMSADVNKKKRIIESVDDLSKLSPDSIRSLTDLAKLKPTKGSDNKKDNSNSDSEKK